MEKTLRNPMEAGNMNIEDKDTGWMLIVATLTLILLLATTI